MDDKFYDLTNQAFVGIMWRFLIAVIFLFILIRVIYFRYSGKEKFLFSFFLMGIIAFFIVSILRSVYIEMGMGFGLFAVFGLLRLRTRNFTEKDMAYTFTVFGIAVVNSLKLVKFPLLGVLIINIIIVLAAYLLEEFVLKYKIETHEIIYDKLELLKPEKKEKLLEDVSLKTGKEVSKIKIRRINYKRKRALLDIYYKEKNHSS
jgi:Domain of unknown function (DUF4956)